MPADMPHDHAARHEDAPIAPAQGEVPAPLWRRALALRGVCGCGDCLVCELAAMRRRTAVRVAGVGR